MQRPYTLSCHCGAVRFEVDAELADLHECNCSTCARHGFLHWKVPVEAVRLVTQKVQLLDLSAARRCRRPPLLPGLRHGAYAHRIQDGRVAECPLPRGRRRVRA